MYSNSWGPTDGYGFWDPGVLTKSAIQEGVTNVSKYVNFEIMSTNLSRHVYILLG